MDEFNMEFDPTDEYESIEPQPQKNNVYDEYAQYNKAQTPNTQIYENQQKAGTYENTGMFIHQTPPVRYSAYQQPNYVAPVVPQPQAHIPAPPIVPVYAPQQQPYVYPVAAEYAPPAPARPAGNMPPVNNQHTVASPPPAHSYAPVSQQVSNPYINNQIKKPKEKQKTPIKAKLFMTFMGVLLVAFIVTIVVLVMRSYKPVQSKDNDDHPLAGYSTEPESESETYAFEDDYGTYFSPETYEMTEFDYDITLESDKGETQKSTTSLNENSYPADKNAKTLKTVDLPKDKNSDKYTTQNAYKAVTDSVVSIECYETEITGKNEDIVSSGAGTIITSDGYIITNSHVILNSKTYLVNVILNNSEQHKAKIVGFDARTDLAVLKIEAKNLQAAKFADSDKTEVGQDIIAIGNPGGTSFQNSLTRGIVSAVDRELDLSKSVKYIQIDAAINPGNSGGPLCNIYGQVIGINTAKISSVVYEGMGFAIPSNTALDIVNDLIKYGYVKDRVRLGIVGVEVDSQMAYTYNLPDGVLITSVEADGPLSDSGVQQYDVITKINSVPIASFSDIYGELEKYKDGDKISITVSRMEY